MNRRLKTGKLALPHLSLVIKPPLKGDALSGAARAAACSIIAI
jgi:hypothetical protein